MSLFIDVSSLPNDISGFCQVVFLTAVYGYILSWGCSCIVKGAELLLCVPSCAALVGSVILPLIGAVPEGLLVLFSGLGSKPQQTISVGVGALTGSTILLLTIPWSLCIIAGRVDIDPATNSLTYRKIPKLSPMPATSSPTEFITAIYDQLFNTGVPVSSMLRSTGKVVIASGCVYALLDIPILLYASSRSSSDSIASAKNALNMSSWSFLGVVFCCSALAGYLLMAYKEAVSSDSLTPSLSDVTSNIITESLVENIISLLSMIHAELLATGIQFPDPITEPAAATSSTERTPLRTSAAYHSPTQGQQLSFHRYRYTTVPNMVLVRLEKILHPIFVKYDDDKNGMLGSLEIAAMLRDLGERDQQTMKLLRLYYETSPEFLTHQGLPFKDFVRITAQFVFEKYSADGKFKDDSNDVILEYDEERQNIQEPQQQQRPSKQHRSFPANPKFSGLHKQQAQSYSQSRDWQRRESGFENAIEEDVEGSGDEADDVYIPTDLHSVDPMEQQVRLKLRSSYLLIVGTIAIVAFSDAMVNCLYELALRMDVSVVYVSFFLGPIAANISEIITSFHFSSKKTPKSIRLSLLALQGSVIMNNTYVTAILLLLVYFRNLNWDFFAETMTVFLVQLMSLCLVQKRVLTFFDSIWILLAYPISVLLILLLKFIGWK